MLVELGLQGPLRLRDGLRGEVNPTGAIRASTNLPIHLQSRDSAKRAQDLVEKIGAGFLGESRVDREKDIIRCARHRRQSGAERGGQTGAFGRILRGWRGRVDSQIRGQNS